MATITLTDTSSLTATAALLDNAALGKTPASVLHFLRSDVIGALDQTLDHVQINSVAIGFNYAPAFSLEGGTATFTGGGSLTGMLNLYKPAGGSTPLFPADQFGVNVDMKARYYLALGFQLSLATGLTETTGAFTLAPSASSTSTATLYMPFAANTAAVFPTLKDALVSLFKTYTLPGSIAAMQALPPGSVFVYDAQGSVSFQAQFDLLAEVNPTASLGVSPTFGPISVVAGPSITVGGGFSLLGEFEVRLWNTDGNAVQLGYYKKRATSFTVSYDASVGADVEVGSYDVFAKIYGLLGQAGTLNAGFLQTIPASVAANVEAAYEAAVQQKLSIALDEECDTSITNQAAFSWNFNPGLMDAEAHAVFEHAMLGDLSTLLGGGALPAGVTKVGSVFDRLTEQKHTFTFNFLGLFNYASVQDAALDMSVKVSDTGQVVIADSASLTRLSATATPFVKSDLLRKVLAEDFVATAGYTASLAGFTSNLSVTYSYFDYLRNAHTSDLQLFVGAAAALAKEENPARDWALVVRAGVASQSASMLASLTYDDRAATCLFLDADSNPLSIDEYQKIARQALLQTPGLGLDASFVSSLADDARWQALLDAGAPGNFYLTLGIDPAAPPQSAVFAYTSTQHVVIWAAAMHSAAQAMQGVRRYCAANPKLDPFHDAGFAHLRGVFASQLKQAVNATPLFNDTLGVITIYLTAAPSSETVQVRYAGKETMYATGAVAALTTQQAQLPHASKTGTADLLHRLHRPHASS